MLSEKTQPLPFSVPEHEPERPPRRGASLGSTLFVVFWMLTGLALVATLCVFWFRELDRRKDAEKRVASAQSEASAATARAEGLEEEIARVEDELAAAQKQVKPLRLRLARRGATLRSARGVVALVTPLEESWAALGEGLVKMDSSGASISAAAGALRREAISLNAYIRRTPAADLSKAKLREHADALRMRADAVVGARSAFVTARAGYADDAEGVEARFDALSRAIVGLRKEIARALRR